MFVASVVDCPSLSSHHPSTLQRQPIMAASYPLDTPSRLLKRVQQMEDMELPSLPSFHHDDLDYDSTSVTETSREYGQDTRSEHQFDQEDEHVRLIIPLFDRADIMQDMATTHPLRQVAVPSAITTAESNSSSVGSFSSTSGSPFPPLIDGSREETPSPYEPTTTLTSTPLSRPSRSQSRSLLDSTTSNTLTATQTIRHERSMSGTGSIASSTVTKRDRWQTPGEMSRSFSGDEIPPSDGLGSERSIPLNDTSEVSHIVPRTHALLKVISSSMTIRKKFLNFHLSLLLKKHLQLDVYLAATFNSSALEDEHCQQLHSRIFRKCGRKVQHPQLRSISGRPLRLTKPNLFNKSAFPVCLVVRLQVQTIASLVLQKDQFAMCP